MPPNGNGKSHIAVWKPPYTLSKFNPPSDRPVNQHENDPIDQTINNPSNKQKHNIQVWVSLYNSKL